MTIWTHHGGALHSAAQAFPDAPQPWLDLSTGINPHPWPHANSVEIDWHRLPEVHDITALEADAGAYYGVGPRHICAVSGSEIAMRIIGSMLGPCGQYALPAYRTHAEMFAQPLPVADVVEADRSLPLIFANPANPSGAVQNAERIEMLLQQRQSWTLIDEAYADATPAISAAHRIADDQKLIIFRSFGKFYGLAGLRLGFLLGPAPLIAQFRSFIGSWPISSAAIAIGRAALADQIWADETRQTLRIQVEHLDALLSRHGFAYEGQCPLFRMIHCDDGPALFAQLARHGILSRPFSDQPQRLRLGLPRDEISLQRLSRAFSDD